MTERGPAEPDERMISVNVGTAARLIGGALEWTRLLFERRRIRRDERWTAKIRDEASKRLKDRA